MISCGIVTFVNVGSYHGTYGWLWKEEGSLSVTAEEGYTITKCVFRQNAKNPITDTEAPFEIHTNGWGYITEDPIWDMNGVTSIEVYGYANAVTVYSVTMKDGTEDASNWQGKAGEGEYQALPLEGVAAGTAVSVKYNGTKKVKSVKAVKKAAASLIVNPAVGQVIGDDGKNYADAAAATSAGATAVVVIAYVGSDNGEAAPYNHGLALALSDANSGSTCQWKTENTDAGHTKQTSSTFTEESGLQYNATHNSNTYPAFKAAIANNDIAAPTGCSSWFLASGYQWNKMIGSTGLGLSILGTGYVAYWSSTGSGSYFAWYFFFNYSYWNDDDKDRSVCVRACLAF